MKTNNLNSFLIWTGVLFISFFLAMCQKNLPDTSSVNKKNTVFNSRSNSVYETYLYMGEYYTLEFDEEDESGVPLNTEIEDALKEAIGDSEFMVLDDIAHPDTIFIFDIPSSEWEPDTTIAMAPAQTPLFATFYQHANYGGYSFNFTDFNYNQHWRGDCDLEFNIPNLANCVMNGTTSWDDQISSFKMHNSDATNTWFNVNGYCDGVLNNIDFCMFRDPGYRQTPSGCWLKIWRMHPTCSPQGDWEVPNLTKERWGWLFCARMNDRISSIGIVCCKYCFPECPSYTDWW